METALKKHVHHVDRVKNVCTECGMTLSAIMDGGGPMDYDSFVTAIAHTLEEVKNAPPSDYD